MVVRFCRMFEPQQESCKKTAVKTLYKCIYNDVIDNHDMLLHACMKEFVGANKKGLGLDKERHNEHYIFL